MVSIKFMKLTTGSTTQFVFIISQVHETLGSSFATDSINISLDYGCTDVSSQVQYWLACTNVSSHVILSHLIIIVFSLIVQWLQLDMQFFCMSSTTERKDLGRQRDMN